MQFAKFVVSGIVPNIEHATIVHVSEDFFAAVIEAAKGNVTIDQDGHRPPKAIAWFANALLFCIAEGTAPIMDAGEVDMVHNILEHLFGLFAIRRLASCCDDNGCRLSCFIAQCTKRFNVLDNLRMVETNSQ